MGRNRLSGATSGALEASLIGLTMAGCIGVGYLIGNWLDGRMGTTYWTPVMVILGIIAGAREMWRTVGRLRKSFSDGTFNDSYVSGEDKLPQETHTSKQNRAATVDPSHRKPRFFHVPPPPAPGDTVADPENNRHQGGEVLEEQLDKLHELQRQIEQAEDEASASPPPHPKKHESE